MNSPFSPGSPGHSHQPGAPYPPGPGPYGAPLPYAPPPLPRTGPSPWVWVILGVVLLGLGTCGGVVGLVALGSAATTGDAAQGGVLMGPEVTDATRSKLQARKLLRPDEQLVAYYDGTVMLDMSEVTVLTSDRITVAKGARVTTIALEDVASIDHRVEHIIGDVIDVRSQRGERMRIEVAHLNGGVSLLNALEDETRDANPDVIVRRQDAR